MRSGWFWQTDAWEAYQQAYYSNRPRPDEYKTSPLSEWDGEGMSALWPEREVTDYDLSIHRSQVIDLRLTLEDLWRGIRKSYRPLINKALKVYEFRPGGLTDYHFLHAQANGRETRTQGTWDCMGRWMEEGLGGLVLAVKDEVMAAGAFFITYHGSAYYHSGPKLVENVQHAVIWTAMKQLKAIGITHLELGQLDGETEKERNIGKFKAGFGGKAVPFTIATRRP